MSGVVNDIIGDPLILRPGPNNMVMKTCLPAKSNLIFSCGGCNR